MIIKCIINKYLQNYIDHNNDMDGEKTMYQCIAHQKKSLERPIDVAIYLAFDLITVCLRYKIVTAHLLKETLSLRL